MAGAQEIGVKGRDLTGTERLKAALVFAGLASFALNGSGQSVFGLAIPVYMRAFGQTQAGASLLLSAFWVGAFLGVLSMIVWPARLTPRIGLSVLAAGSALIAWQILWPVVLLGAMVFGFGYGALAAIFNRRFLTEFGTRGPAMVGLLNAMFSVGAIVAPIVFVWFGGDPRPTYLLITGLALAALPFARPGQIAAPALGLALWSGLRPGILIFGTLAIGFEASMIGLGPTALLASGLTEPRTAELTSMFFVAFMVARLALFWIAQHVVPFRMMVVALAASGLAILGAVFVAPGPFFVISGASVGLIFPGFFVSAVNRLGDDPRIAPIIIASGLVGGITVPLLLGALSAQAGAGWLFGLMASLALGIALCALLAHREFAPKPAVG